MTWQVCIFNRENLGSEHVLYEPEKYPPKNEVPWNIILEELDRLVERTDNSEMLLGE